jgi:hypothetical protein
MTHSSVYIDGEDNMKHHNILQERTLAFLNKNIIGHGFIYGQHGENVDRIDQRLKIRVSHLINDLDVLGARIEYAEVPKRWEILKKILLYLVNKLLGLAPDFLAKYLKSKGY